MKFIITKAKKTWFSQLYGLMDGIRLDKNSSGDEMSERELLRSAPGSYPNSLK